MYSSNKKVALIAVIAIGGIGFVAAGRTLQQSATQQQTTSCPQASEGRQIHGTPGSPDATETLAYNNMSGIGKSGTGALKVDGRMVGTQKMDRTVPLILQWDETFDIGADTGTSVDDSDYRVSFRFPGKIDKLTIKLEPPKLTSTDEQKLKEAAARAGDAQ